MREVSRPELRGLIQSVPVVHKPCDYRCDRLLQQVWYARVPHTSATFECCWLRPQFSNADYSAVYSAFLCRVLTGYLKSTSPTAITTFQRPVGYDQLRRFLGDGR